MPEPDPLPSIKTPWGSATPPTGASAGHMPPIPIPDHKLIRRIGKGSYGEVWLARNALGVYRAVKIIDRRAFDDDRPFEREFAGMQRFEPVSRSHESQLNILQVGRGPHCFYYVMELADDMGRGPAIDEASYTPRNLRSELLLRGRLPVDECIRLGLALTTALENLHRHGLVHRDIKPSNIVFVNGIPKLADIGLVALAESTMSFVGTEGYLPPEGPGTVQADLFSLGKVLYEIGTGRDRQQFPELPTGIRKLPDRAALAEFNEVLLRACAPDVKQRYESAAEMHADLALLQSGKSVSRMRAVERRLKFVARAGAVVTAIAFLAGLAFFYQQLQTREARRLASENQALAAAKTQLAADKSKLAEENREQLVRLHVANGVRLLDEGDHSAALLWFAGALPLVTDQPAEEDIHRIRIQQVLQQTPRLLLSVGCSNSVRANAWSPDGKRFALTTRRRQGADDAGQVRLHDATDGHVIWTAEFPNVRFIGMVRFSRDGKRLLVSSSPEQAVAAYGGPSANLAVVLNAGSGHALYPQFASNLVWAAFSPDERWLALARSNCVIQVVNAGDGTPVVELKGHTNRITMLSFSTDGRLLASASEDRSARIWRLPSGEEAVPAMLHDRPLRRMALSDEASKLGTATIGDQADGDEGQVLVHVWDAQTGKRIGGAITEPCKPYALFFSPGSGDFLYTGGNGPKIRVWDTRSSSLLPLGDFNHDGSRCWGFSPDGAFLAMGDDGGHADLFRLADRQHILARFLHTGYVESLHFSPDGTRLLTASDDGTAKVWLLEQKAESAALALPSSFSLSAFHDAYPRGRTPGPIPIDLQDGAIHLVDPDRLVEECSLKPREVGNKVSRWSAGRTGRFWALAESIGGASETPDTVALWQQTDAGLRRVGLPHPKMVPFMAFTPDDSRLVTFCCDSTVRIWRTSDGEVERIVSVPEAYAYLDVALSSAGNYWFRPDAAAVLLSRGKGTGQAQLFDLAKGELVGRPISLSSWGDINEMAFSPDGRRIAVVGGGQTGQIFDLTTGELAVTPFKHGGTLLDIDWSPDGRRVLTAGLAHDVRIWEAATGELSLSPLPTGKHHNRTARWSEDGRFVVTRSDDNLARVWDASTAEAVTPLLQHSGYIRWACVTRSNRLITASEPNLLRAWDLRPTALTSDVIADYAKLLSGRRLNTGGVLLPIPAAELIELANSLRIRAPQLFD